MGAVFLFNTDKRSWSGDGSSYPVFHVDLNQTTTNFIFDVACKEESGEWKRQVLMNGHVQKKFKQICPRKTLRIAYNNEEGRFQVDKDDNIVKFPYSDSLTDLRQGEILSSFLASLNLLPVWTNCNRSYIAAAYEVDLSVGAFAVLGQATVIFDFTPAFQYGATYWYTAAPQTLPTFTNLIRIFDTPCWILTLLVILSVSLYFVSASVLGGHYGVQTELNELVLIPFRLPVAVRTHPTNTNRGLTSTYMTLIWSTFGGILLYAFHSNFLSMLVSPTMENPLDTAEDILAKGLIPIVKADSNWKKKNTELTQ